MIARASGLGHHEALARFEAVEGSIGIFVAERFERDGEEFVRIDATVVSNHDGGLRTEDAGIAALAVHGRTRADLYQGEAEYETIAAIRQAIRIPLLANGDIDSPQKAAAVLKTTGADAVMIGRAAQGRPWIFREIAHFLASGDVLAAPSPLEVRDILVGHLEALYAFHGELPGVRIARKHLGWYARDRAENAAFRSVVNGTDCAQTQLRLTRDYFDRLADSQPLAA